MLSIMARTWLVGTLAAAAMLAACGPTRRAENSLPTGPLGDSDPLAAIIERRPELQLVDSQVAVLRVLKRELERVNDPIRDELERLGIIRQVESMRRLPERPTKEQEEKAKPLIEQMRENNRRAREAALAVLNSTQRVKLDSLEARVRVRREQNQRRSTPPS